jgi:hypothetical protein
MSPLCAIGQGRRIVRMVNNYGGTAYPRTLRGSARRMGLAPRDGGGLFGRPANLRISEIDHVREKSLLLPCTPPKELSGRPRFLDSNDKGASGTTRGCGLKDQAAHFIGIRHLDEAEPLVTDWLRKAYELADPAASRSAAQESGAKRASRSQPKKHPKSRSRVALRADSRGCRQENSRFIYQLAGRSFRSRAAAQPPRLRI